MSDTKLLHMQQHVADVDKHSFAQMQQSSTLFALLWRKECEGKTDRKASVCSQFRCRQDRHWYAYELNVPIHLTTHRSAAPGQVATQHTQPTF